MTVRRRRLCALALVTLIASLLEASGAGAQLLPPLGGETTTTTTKPPPPPTTQAPPPTSPPPTDPPPTSPPPTDPPPSSPAPTSPPPSDPAPSDPAPGGGGGAPQPPAPPPAADPPAPSDPASPAGSPDAGLGVVDTPADIVGGDATGAPLPPMGDGLGADPNAPRLPDGAVDAILESLQRSGASSTVPLLEALRQLEELGFDAREAALIGMGSFPVAGRANYRDDWLEPRLTPTPHPHKGNDIFAPFDTPVKAPVDGTVRFAEEGAGGKAAYVTAPDGTYYYMAHLSGFSTEIPSGSRVRSGDVVGFTGDTGNAKGGAPHVHLQIHPNGGEPVNPKPILDAWLQAALARVPELVAAYRNNHPRVMIATGITRRFDASLFSGTPSPPMDALVWASTVSPGGGAIRLAEAQLARVADRIDWRRRTAAAQARAAVDTRATDMAARVLSPLTPPALAPMLERRR